MYYSKTQYLAQQGYVVLTPDYRGSSGYSRDWAVGASRDLGGAETEDVNAGADYLKTLSYVDPERIGIWGLSYGGFMTMQSILADPRLFRCAINVAGVGDWETWMTGGLILGRLGETAVTDTELYNRSAPVKHLDSTADSAADPSRHQRCERSLLGDAQSHRHSGKTRKTVRVEHLPRRNPLFSPRLRSA